MDDFNDDFSDGFDNPSEDKPASDGFENYSVDSEPTGSSSGGGIPTWVWIVGIIVVILCICPIIVIAILSVIGASVGNVFDDVSATLEADFGSEGAVPLGTLVAEESGEGVNLPSDEASGDYDYIAEFGFFSDWPEGEILNDDGVTVDAEVETIDGVYRFTILAPEGLYWSTPGDEFGDGIYEAEITVTQGSVSNAGGLMFGFNEFSEDFYYFEVGSDGFASIGQCFSNCAEFEALVGGDTYFQSDAIFQGLNITNRLRAEVRDGTITYFINGTNVGSVSGQPSVNGAIGVVVEAFEDGGEPLVYEIDNVSFRSWDN